jgi:hypothetical protein
MLIIANVVTIGANIAAISASTHLVLPQVPMVFVIVSYTAFIISRDFDTLQKICEDTKISCISLFAYAITAIIVGIKS